MKTPTDSHPVYRVLQSPPSPSEQKNRRAWAHKRSFARSFPCAMAVTKQLHPHEIRNPWPGRPKPVVSLVLPVPSLAPSPSTLLRVNSVESRQVGMSLPNHLIFLLPTSYFLLPTFYFFLPTAYGSFKFATCGEQKLAPSVVEGPALSFRLSLSKSCRRSSRIPIRRDELVEPFAILFSSRPLRFLCELCGKSFFSQLA